MHGKNPDNPPVRAATHRNAESAVRRQDGGLLETQKEILLKTSEKICVIRKEAVSAPPEEDG